MLNGLFMYMEHQFQTDSNPIQNVNNFKQKFYLITTMDVTIIY